jgi:hypothetical protein
MSASETPCNEKDVGALRVSSPYDELMGHTCNSLPFLKQTKPILDAIGNATVLTDGLNTCGPSNDDRDNKEKLTCSLNILLCDLVSKLNKFGCCPQIIRELLEFVLLSAEPLEKNKRGGAPKRQKTKNVYFKQTTGYLSDGSSTEINFQCHVIHYRQMFTAIPEKVNQRSDELLTFDDSTYINKRPTKHTQDFHDELYRLKVDYSNFMKNQNEILEDHHHTWLISRLEYIILGSDLFSKYDGDFMDITIRVLEDHAVFVLSQQKTGLFAAIRLEMDELSNIKGHLELAAKLSKLFSTILFPKILHTDLECTGIILYLLKQVQDGRTNTAKVEFEQLQPGKHVGVAAIHLVYSDYHMGDDEEKSNEMVYCAPFSPDVQLYIHENELGPNPTKTKITIEVGAEVGADAVLLAYLGSDVKRLFLDKKRIVLIGDLVRYAQLLIMLTEIIGLTSTTPVCKLYDAIEIKFGYSPHVIRGFLGKKGITKKIECAFTALLIGSSLPGFTEGLLANTKLKSAYWVAIHKMIATCLSDFMKSVHKMAKLDDTIELIQKLFPGYSEKELVETLGKNMYSILNHELNHEGLNNIIDQNAIVACATFRHEEEKVELLNFPQVAVKLPTAVPLICFDYDGTLDGNRIMALFVELLAGRHVVVHSVRDMDSLLALLKERLSKIVDDKHLGEGVFERLLNYLTVISDAPAVDAYEFGKLAKPLYSVIGAHTKKRLLLFLAKTLGCHVVHIDDSKIVDRELTEPVTDLTAVHTPIDMKIGKYFLILCQMYIELGMPDSAVSLVAHATKMFIALDKGDEEVRNYDNTNAYQSAAKIWEGSKKHVSLNGSPGSGKTSMAIELLKQFTNITHLATDFVHIANGKYVFSREGAEAVQKLFFAITKANIQGRILFDCVKPVGSGPSICLPPIYRTGGELRIFQYASKDRRNQEDQSVGTNAVFTCLIPVDDDLPDIHICTRMTGTAGCNTDEYKDKTAVFNLIEKRVCVTTEGEPVASWYVFRPTAGGKDTHSTVSTGKRHNGGFIHCIDGIPPFALEPFGFLLTVEEVKERSIPFKLAIKVRGTDPRANTILPYDEGVALVEEMRREKQENELRSNEKKRAKKEQGLKKNLAKLGAKLKGITGDLATQEDNLVELKKTLAKQEGEPDIAKTIAKTEKSIKIINSRVQGTDAKIKDLNAQIKKICDMNAHPTLDEEKS